MADVGRPRDNRGQLIIITGLVIAVTLVALTLLLNTAIYTENLASRGTSVDGSNAINFLQSTDETVDELVEIENDQEHSSHDEVTSNVRDGIHAYDQAQREQHARIGTSVQITDITFHEGTRLRQTDTAGNFTNRTDAADWEVVTGTSDLRMFDLRIEYANETTDPEEGAFTLSINGDWNLFVYDDNGIALAVSNDSHPTPVPVCDPAGGYPLRLNLTAGTVNGEPCDDLEFTKSADSPYTVMFTRGDEAAGTYNLTVNGTSSVDSTNFYSDNTDSPYQFDVIYSAHFDVEYRTEDVYYRSRVRVARGEQV